MRQRLIAAAMLAGLTLGAAVRLAGMLGPTLSG